MPKSKRNKVVHLTQVKKKGKDHREDLKKQVEKYCAQFKYMYIFNFEHTKSNQIMKLRLRLKEHGRIFAGKNSIVTSTLKSLCPKTNLQFDNLIDQIVGHRGLFFADIPKDKLMELLDRDQPEFCKRLLGYILLGSSLSRGEVELRT